MKSRRHDRVCLGAVSGAIGIKGEVRLKSFATVPADIAAYGPLTDDDGTTVEIVSLRHLKKGLAARIRGIDSRNQAEALKGRRLYVGRDALPPADDEDYYIIDLIGLKVVDAAGQPWGHIRAVADYGAGDLLEIEPLSGAGIVVPFRRRYVPVVDIDAGQVTISTGALEEFGGG